MCVCVNFDVQLFYMGLVIFTPATAMEAMTDFPLWASVIITGLVATVYTTVVSSCLNSLMLQSRVVNTKKLLLT